MNDNLLCKDFKSVKITKNDVWLCSLCEYVNKYDDRICGACEEIQKNTKDNFKDNSYSKQMIEQSNLDNCEMFSDNYNEEERNGDCVNNNKWKCVSCKFVNWINKDFCAVCGVNNVNISKCYFMWECTKCGVDNLISNRTCEGCNAVDPDIDKLLCEDYNFENVANVDNSQSKQINEELNLIDCETSSVNYNEEERNGDCVNNNVWKCMSCNIDNLINNSVCVACGVNKDDKVCVPESHVMWRCTKCGIDNLLSNRTCVGCDAIDPNIDKWVCEQCSFVNKKCAVECSVCGMKNNNFVKCTMCGKASVFVWDGTVCEDCLRKVQNSEKCENCKQIVEVGFLCESDVCIRKRKQKIRICAECGNAPVSRGSLLSGLCNECLVVKKLCRCCYNKIIAESDGILCYVCGTRKWVCGNDKCGAVNSNMKVICTFCRVRNTTKNKSDASGKCRKCSIYVINSSSLCVNCRHDKCGQVRVAGRKCGYSDCGKVNSALSSETRCNFCKSPFGTENLDKCKTFWCQQYIERGSTLCSNCSKTMYVCSNDKCGQVNFINFSNKCCDKCGQVRDAGRKCGYSDCGKINSALSSDTRCNFCKRPFGTENMDKCKVDWCQQYIERGSTLCSYCSKTKYVCSNDKCGQVNYISINNKCCYKCGQVKDAGRKCCYSDCGKINSALSSDTQCDFCKRPFPVYTLNNKSNKPIN